MQGWILAPLQHRVSAVDVIVSCFRHFPVSSSINTKLKQGADMIVCGKFERHGPCKVAIAPDAYAIAVVSGMNRLVVVVVYCCAQQLLAI
jgi:hypothetical protein